MNDNDVETVRENYDRLAEEYANRIFDELRHKPFDRELLNRFAAQLKGQGEVCDLGCGPGHVARYLRDANLPVFGLDLSPGMLQQARRLNPDITFREGDMLALNIPTGTLAGIAAFYAIVNIPKESLALAFREMLRVLKSGGLLLIAFHVGDDVVRPSELWDVPVAMAFFHFKTVEILQGLEMAGFTVNEVIERDAYPDVEYQSRRAYVLAGKPDLAPKFPGL